MQKRLVSAVLVFLRLLVTQKALQLPFYFFFLLIFFFFLLAVLGHTSKSWFY